MSRRFAKASPVAKTGKLLSSVHYCGLCGNYRVNSTSLRYTYSPKLRMVRDLCGRSEGAPSLNQIIRSLRCIAIANNKKDQQMG